MSKKNNIKQYNVSEMPPDEVDELKKSVAEFVTRCHNIDNEIALLKEDRKELIDEFKDKLDMKTLQAALKVVKIEQSIEHKDTYDLFTETIKDSE